MIRWLLKRQVDKAERELGVPVDETRYILDHSIKALMALRGLQKIARFDEALPAEAYHTAKIAAHRVADCGSCLQIAVNLATKSGMKAELIRDLVAGRTQKLSPPLRDVFQFAEEQSNRIDNPELRERLRRTYGDEGLITLATALISSQTFPVLKRALGFSVSCSRVEIVA
jgi:alkylhydroperoxidase family enzyme